MEHCRWWSQCKTFHEYKCFEPDWPSRDCDCACVRVCVCAFFFSSARVSAFSSSSSCTQSPCSCRIHIGPQGQTHTQIRHRDVSEAILSRQWVVPEPPQRKWADMTSEEAPATPDPLPLSPSHFVCFSLLSYSLSELLHPPKTKKPQQKSVGCHKDMKMEKGRG